MTALGDWQGDDSMNSASEGLAVVADRALMKAVVTTGVGGYDRLVYGDVPKPTPGPGEVLVRVLAAGVNNTEINTRVGWYSSSVTAGTAGRADDHEVQDAPPATDGGWNRPTPFPLIQGTDCCGVVEAVGPGVVRAPTDARVLVRSCMRPAGFGSRDSAWLGSDRDGAFAQFVAVPAGEVFAVECDWTDAELATLPCAYGTAENMLQRAGLGPGERVLVTGASGGVGSAVVQLALRRGAHVFAIAGNDKVERVRALGAEVVIPRGDDPASTLGKQSVDVVVDNVAGAAMPALLEVLRRGGRYVSSGAIAGPLVTVDLRAIYLKDLTLLGCTAWDEPVFPNLVTYVERGEIRPLLAKTFPLARIIDAQKQFLEKKHLGKFVVIPPT